MKIAIRVDASVQIGSGHVMRCLTLADELRQSGAEVTFISRRHEGNLNGLIHRKGFRLLELESTSQCNSDETSQSAYANWLGVSQDEDARETIAALDGATPDWLIVDHYAIDEAWEKLFRPHVRNIMVIDDLANRKHDCDLLLDQNYVKDPRQRYEGLVPPSCTRLLGPSYALLRREFALARTKVNQRTGEVNRVFLFFGGVDPDNMTGKALEALMVPDLRDLDVDVVLGSANPHKEVLQELVGQRPRTNLHVQVDNIATLMSQADLALCAGGSSTWERLCLGLPSLVVTIAENQEPFTFALHDGGFLRRLGSNETVASAEISSAIISAIDCPVINREESERCGGLVDGKGVQRVVEMIMNGPDLDGLQIRRVKESDCELLWCWANDPEVRRNAFSAEPIPWEDHCNWFYQRFRDAVTSIYILESENGPVGQVRFEKHDDKFTVGYSIARQYRGKGVATVLLTLALRRLMTDQPYCIVLADVKTNNTPSIRAFQSLGFQEVEHRPNVRRFLFQCTSVGDHGPIKG
jgi:UDP-2,4-diacetamido-2,4,6-trideoxy-beta-L-altropyranose hydrolase